MATELDNKFVPLAKSLIDRYGKSLTFTVPGGVYNPSTGGLDNTVSPATFTVKASPPAPYRVGYSSHKSATPKGESYNDISRDGDMILYVAASGLPFTPVAGVGVSIGGFNWNCVDVMSIYSGESVAVYGMIFRKEG